MMVSIIIVSYNEKNYLEEAINSCLNQHLVDGCGLEIVIGDDGSSDGSVEIIKKYKDTYPDVINYFVNSRNDKDTYISSLRVSELIKKALNICRGDYIQLLSADDLLEDNEKIFKSVKFLKDNNNYASVCTNYFMFWDDGKKENIVGLNGYTRNILLAREYYHISCFVFRRDVIKNLLPRFCDDTGFVLSIYASGKVKFITSFSFGYRQRKTGITSSSKRIILNMSEVMVLQDALNSKKYVISYFSKACSHLIYVFKNRCELKKGEYKVYIDNSKLYKNDILGKIYNYDNCNVFAKTNLLSIIAFSMIANVAYRIIQKIEYIFVTVYNVCKKEVNL